MLSFDAPSMDTFKPEGSYRVLGADYIAMRHPDGVRLDLSAAGALAIDQDPDVADLFTRMGEFIAEHGTYRATRDVEDAEPGRIMAVGQSKRESARDGYRKICLASVYHHDAAPNAVVKAYDHDRRSAAFQFYLGAWLHTKLAEADDGISSPAQLALFRSGAKILDHRTTVMDYVPGQNLYNMISALGSGDRFEQNMPEVERIAVDTSAQLRERIIEMTGWRGAFITNDMRNLRNIMVSDPETATPDNLSELEYTVIDQPVIKKRHLVQLTAALHLPLLGGGTYEQPERPAEAIESSATLS